MNKGINITLTLLAWIVMTTPLLAHEVPNPQSLEISWKALSGYGTYAVYGQAPSVMGSGMMVELLSGKKINNLQGLEVALGGLFLLMPGSRDFDIINPTSSTTEHWKITTYAMGSGLMAKYSYQFNIGVIKVKFENGFGLMYLLAQEDTRAYNLATPNNIYSTTTREQSFEPIADIHCKVMYQLDTYNSLGLCIGGLLADIQAGSYQNVGTLSIGVTYQVAY